MHYDNPEFTYSMHCNNILGNNSKREGEQDQSNFKEG